MMKKTVLLFIVISFSAYGITFNKAIEALHKHESVESMIRRSRATSEEARQNGSWGDPIFKIAAKNYPQDTLVNDQTPMTGIEFGISQKISLTTKYGNIEDAFKSLSKAYSYEADDKKEALTKAFWEVLILKRRIHEELRILKENGAWIGKILKVSKKLYANGKTSQQAILEIQIRKSEIESEISNKSFELLQVEDNIGYLVGSSKVKEESIPWRILNERPKEVVDNKALTLREKLKARDLSLTASKLNYIPDLTVSLSVTKRSDIDDNGDFIGASISFPLPFSGSKYSAHNKATQEKFVAVKNYENYKRAKNRDVSLIEKEIKKLVNELSILKNKTIKYANNSRSITSKSYALGNSSYVELLQSELKLQRILMHQLMLEAKRDVKKVTLKYILGESIK
jgi:outer membrane protein TolC